MAGQLENRLRYPLEVFAAMRAAWPSDRPMSVRISANDWAGEDGVTPDEAVEIGEAFAREGADLIDVSAGQTWADAQPVYGRMFQTPFPDKIRNEGRLATMAVGNIYEPDHANSILAAGRADLVALARPAFDRPDVDPPRRRSSSTTATSTVPPQYLNGLSQLARNLKREAEADCGAEGVMMSNFTELESAVLHAIFRRRRKYKTRWSASSKWQRWLNGKTPELASSRDCRATRCAARLKSKSARREVRAKVDGLDHGMGFILFMKEGHMQTLEGFTSANSTLS